MKNSDIERINLLLMNNKWMLDSVNAIISTIPGGAQLKLADGFILVLRGLIRASARIQEVFAVKERMPNANENYPRFIGATERLLEDNMDWIKPLVEEYTPIDFQEDCCLSSSIEELFATAEECSLSDPQ